MGSGHLVFARHLDRIDAAKLSVLLQQNVSLALWSSYGENADADLSELAQGLARFEVADQRVDVTCSVPGLERNTGLLLNVACHSNNLSGHRENRLDSCAAPVPGQCPGTPVQSAQPGTDSQTIGVSCFASSTEFRDASLCAAQAGGFFRRSRTATRTSG